MVRDRCNAGAARRPAVLNLPAARIAAALVALAGLAPTGGAAQGPPCHAPTQTMQRIELMFGRNVGTSLAVTEEDWRLFLTREVVPRFPDGFSVVDADGPRSDRDTSRVVNEPSKIIIIIAPDSPETETRVAAVEAAYKSQFRQESVVVVTRAVCASF